jgi:hypothetical protein
MKDIRARYPVINAIQFDGSWNTTVTFINELTDADFNFGYPDSSHPPVTINHADGRGIKHLKIHGSDGHVMDVVWLNEWLCHAIHPANGSNVFFKMTDKTIHAFYDIPMENAK